MSTLDRDTLAEWLDLELDGQLGRAERTRLAQRLEADSELAAEKRLLESLHALLREGRIPVRAGFRERVTAALPSPAWQRSRVPVWALPVAMVVVLGVASALVLGSGASVSEAPLVGAGLAVLDFVKMTALAGAGLAAASWQGFGLVLEELFASSGLNLVSMAILVLFLNLLLVFMLRRRPATEVVQVLERDASNVSEASRVSEASEDD